MPTIRLRKKFWTTAFLNTLKFAINRACLLHQSWKYHRFPINLRLSNSTVLLWQDKSCEKKLSGFVVSNSKWLHYDDSKWPRVLSHMLKPAIRAICSEIVTLVTILLVIPATNTTSERTFSALRRVKTYLRSTMTQTRMNNLITLHVHTERTDALDLKAITNEFTARNELRS